MGQSKPLKDGPNWTFDDLQAYLDVIGELATDTFKFDTYRNQIEIVSSEQMLDAYAFNGLPICYHHWRYGKYFSQSQRSYHMGQNLAYELVINSDPCISYFMSENNLVTQALVAAHAAYGHNSFFKNNFLFKKWTHADAIVDYMIFARDFIKKCEEKHGYEEVEETLDAAHALERHGVDKYKRPPSLSATEEKILQEKRVEEQYKDVWYLENTLPADSRIERVIQEKFLSQPEENILYFLEKHSPNLESWQREIIRIVRKISQYFYPQSQTKISNEGYATFWHYEILYELWNRGRLTNSFMQSFLNLHTAVVHQPDYNQIGGDHLNFYYMSFYIYQDIKRICTKPTKEDEEWFPWLVGRNWISAVHEAAFNFKDESFILQYLSPNLMRKMRLFSIFDDSADTKYVVSSISNETGYKQLRSIISKIYNRAYMVPDVQIVDADMRHTRRLTLQHYAVDDIPLQEKSMKRVIEHLKYLWGFDVEILSNARPNIPFNEEDYYVYI